MKFSIIPTFFVWDKNVNFITKKNGFLYMYLA